MAPQRASARLTLKRRETVQQFLAQTDKPDQVFQKRDLRALKEFFWSKGDALVKGADVQRWWTQYGSQFEQLHKMTTRGVKTIPAVQRKGKSTAPGPRPSVRTSARRTPRQPRVQIERLEQNSTSQQARPQDILPPRPAPTQQQQESGPRPASPTKSSPPPPHGLTKEEFMTNVSSIMRIPGLKSCHMVWSHDRIVAGCTKWQPLPPHSPPSPPEKSREHKRKRNKDKAHANRSATKIPKQEPREEVRDEAEGDWDEEDFTSFRNFKTEMEENDDYEVIFLD